MSRHNACKLRICYLGHLGFYPRGTAKSSFTRRICDQSPQLQKIQSALLHTRPSTRAFSAKARTERGFPSKHDGTTLSSPGVLYTSNPLLPPLPPLPELSLGIPVLLSEQECGTYLPILYSRGWELTNTIAGTLDVSQLTIKYSFAKYLHTTRFVNEVIKLVNKEKHHPTISFDYPTVTVSTYTHVAQSSPELKEKLNQQNVPGLTLRDIRLAILVEDAFEHFVGANEGTRNIGPRSRQPRAETVKLVKAIPDAVERV